MSDEKITMALAFLQTHPDTAAATLEQHEVGSVATFLSGIPQATSASVLHNMLPNFAARVCNALTREVTLGVFSHLETGQIVAILRHMNRDQRQGFIKELPAKSQLYCSFLLNYSQEVVGAWISPNISTVSHDCMVGDALNSLKNSTDTVSSDFVYVINREQVLQGRTRLVDLLKAKRKMALSSLTESCGKALSCHARIFQASQHENWKKDHEIPVTNRNREFVGVLRQVDLKKAMDHLAPNPDFSNKPNTFTGLGTVYGESLSALFNSLKELVEIDFRS